MDERLLSNIIPKENVRKVQLNVLESISNTVMRTAGPYGSNTMILNKEAPPSYSKDGKKVLNHIRYYGPFENSIVEELSNLTDYVVKQVGDGTTSAIRLAYHIFGGLLLKENYNWENIPTHMITEAFQQTVELIKSYIEANGRKVTIDDIYNICMISTNGNTHLSTDISTLYKAYGSDVYIDVALSNDSDYKIKEYDGITLDKGYSSEAYINNASGHCKIRNPRLYYFADPVDTEEMIGYLTKILSDNIIVPASTNSLQDVVPTVIICPSISRDAEVTLKELEQFLYSLPEQGRPPVLIISQLNRYVDQIEDISLLCGCNPIKKYIDPDVQAAEIKEGKAPTIHTITDWYGTCEEIDADFSKTKFINPANMYSNKVSESGEREYSDTYKGLVNFLKAQIKSANDENEDMLTIGRLNKRLRVLNSSYVEYYIGGISDVDKNAEKDLVEDAILNCRSAVENGVGYGSNFEGRKAARKAREQVLKTYGEYSLIYNVCDIIANAYDEITSELYNTAFNTEEVDSIIKKSDEMNMPINLRTRDWDGTVLSSISTDIVILDGVSKIVNTMFTANQALVYDPMMNKYFNID